MIKLAVHGTGLAVYGKNSLENFFVISCMQNGVTPLLEAVLRFFLCFDNFVAPGIELGVFLLQFGM